VAERRELEASARALVPGLVVERDAFANLWLVLPGRSAETVLVTSHTDSVPGGGWLDGILGVHAGLELLAALAAGGGAERTVAVVDWADEEGTRFGRSLLGSSAATGQLTHAELDGLRDAAGGAAADVLAEHDVALGELGRPSPRLADVVAAVELHIEQGPVLERAGRSCGAVSGCLGVRRSRVQLRGAAGHAGATPMDQRRDPVRAAAEAIAAVADAVQRRGGLATVGRIEADPEMPTAVAERCTFTLDLRHGALDELEALDRDARELTQAAADRHGVTVEHAELWRIDPIAFDDELVARAVAASDGEPAIVSGPLHDSAALARAGIPAAMLFVASIGGVSHTRAEDSAEADLAAGIAALARLVEPLAR
jgi:N-carbamoyl-L-amino-acid hydrolase